MSEELKSFDKVLDSWKRAEGFTVWADDHAGVLRNLSAYVERHTRTPDHTALVPTTKCAVCLEDKPTPFRRDEMGGYVCLTCVDKRLDTQDALVRQLVEAIEQVGKWFGEYADSHEKKGDSEKCIRNVARKAYCLAALTVAKQSGF